MQKTISLVVPVYNEEKNLPLMAALIKGVFSTISDYKYELIFVNDGSRDNSQIVIEQLASNDSDIKFIEFSRNFGKEAATSAGLAFAIGDAVMMADADLQHPVALIPQFITQWEAGFDQVIGIRTTNVSTSLTKKIASRTFYIILNCISGNKQIPGTTDFRLIDRRVVDAYNELTERNRMTRGLLEWLGFRKTYIEFEAGVRAHGEATYSYYKLLRLAFSSFIAHSLFPLKFAGYVGVFITTSSFLLGTVVFIQGYLYDDLLGWNVSGTSQLAILNVFLIGIVLASLGLVALYIGSIHEEVTNRPLYVVRSKKNT